MLEALASDWRQAGLSGPDRKLCELAENLAKDSLSITAAGIDDLKATGLSDRAIHDAVQVVSYFCYINRIADALGIEDEDWLPSE